MSRAGNLAMWQNGLNWMEDDEDQDSDTDSKLSGSAIVDSVMKRLRSHGHRKDHFEFSDSLNHQIQEQDEEEEEREPSQFSGGGVPSVSSHTHSTSLTSNGYRDTSRHPHQHSGHAGAIGTSPSRHYYPPGGGGPSAGARKDILGTVPEMSHSGARVVDMTFGPPMSPSSVLSSTVASQGPSPHRGGFSHQQGVRNWASGARSMDALHHTPIQPQREAPPYRPPPMEGAMGSRSQEAIHHYSSHSPPVPSHHHYDDSAGSDVNNASYHRPRLGSHGNSPTAKTSAVSSQFHSSKSHSPSHVAPGSHSHPVMTSPSHAASSQYPGSHSRSAVPLSSRTPPVRRANHERSDGHSTRQAFSAHNTPHHHTSSDHTSSSARSNPGIQSREPNLNDVVDFLSSGDTGLVANAASYLQHLAYGDDSMKAKIRQYGAIPALIGQLRNEDTKVVVPVLGALRNLSFGRINDENKLMMVREQGLEELMRALTTSRVMEVREMITSVLWNISSCDDVKMSIVHSCVQDLVDFSLIPYSGWNWDTARDPIGKPAIAKWNVELRNIAGTLKNISSAGEPARVFMRQVKGLVDSLLWLSKAAVQHRPSADEKTVESVMCVLRNLSYQLESEVDLQDGAEDVLDRDWEAEQSRDLEEVSAARPKKASTPGCLSMCTRPKTTDSARHSSPPPAHLDSRRSYVSRPSVIVDFANPDPSVFPRRNRQVQGAALLWQPEVVFPYLATLDLYGGCADTLEAAAGAIQNITACSWKWAVYARNMIRAVTGLRVMAELLNNGHDAVVRAGATCLRNITTDPRNKASLGSLVIPAIIPRLPFGSNHLGISESTTVALLVLLMEVCANSSDNARLFRDKEGTPYLTRLSRSRQHTIKIVFAANKICSILYSYKECKPSLKREGWEQSAYLRMQREYSGQFEFESAGATSRQSKHKKRSTVKEDKKRRTGREREREENEGGGRQAGMVEAPRHEEPRPSSLQRSTSPQEPGYQTISTATAATASARVHPSSGAQQAPTTIYQTIDEVGTSASSRGASPLPPHPPSSSSYAQHEGGSAREISASPARVAAGGDRGEGGEASVASTPLVPEEIVPDPNATYAAVEQIKERKRSSRREKERQKIEQEQQEHLHHQPPPPLLEEPSDSWV